jgi:ADP-heptose:LPS heptosyltransferase
MKTRIFWATGGMGKAISSTVIIRLLKLKYPTDTLVVITPHPLIFKNNPYIDEIHSIEKVNDVYQKHFKRSTEILVREPYNESSFINRKESLLETWARLYDLKLNPNPPQLFFGLSELDKYKKIFKSDKPIFVIHPFGGGTKNYNWVRDIHPIMAQQVVDHYSKTHTVYQIKSKEQPLLEGAIAAEQNVRKIAALLEISDKRLLIDSFSQHLAASLKLKSTVCWYMTSPKSYGYSTHNNLTLNVKSTHQFRPLTFTVPQGINLSEPIEMCPFESLENLHTFDNIIKELNK